jgi:hypothetical protein
MAYINYYNVTEENLEDHNLFKNFKKKGIFNKRKTFKFGQKKIHYENIYQIF